MKFLRKLVLIQTESVKSLASISRSKTSLHYNLSPPKSNQTLKSYSESHEPIKALRHFREVLRLNPPALDSFSLLFVLKSCTINPIPNQGKQIHALIFKLGCESIVHLQTSLMRFYSSSENLADACRAFEMPERNTLSWTVLISSFVENQRPDIALELFRRMWTDSFEPDRVAITVALSACADRGALEIGKGIHSYVMRCLDRFDVDLSLENALIDMYAKCGDVGTARKVFDGIETKDATTWTSMIVGHALHGQAEEALELFLQMKRKSGTAKKMNDKRKSIVPNDVTFIGILTACSHAGLVREAKLHYRSMIEDYNINPREPHSGCLVDALCRAGRLEEARDFIAKLPVGCNAVLWRTLLGACCLQGNVKLGKMAREKLLELDPSYVGDYVAMSNIYAGKGMWDEKIRVRDRIKERREAGRSLIEVGSEISEFVSGDEEHPLMAEIRDVLKCLADSMKEVMNNSLPSL